MESTESADVAAIRALVDRMRDAWAAGDATAYADCFSPDSDYVTFNGMHLCGRKENADLHGALFRGILKGTRLSVTINSIVLLSPEVALIHTVGSGPQRRPATPPRRKSMQTLIAMKQDRQWRIRAFQNTRIQPFSLWLTRIAVRFWG